MSQVVKFLGPTTAYTSPNNVKSIIIGGTFANNTNNQQSDRIALDSSVGVTAAIASKIPIPAGSSFVISDTGKTLLESNDEVRVYCDVDDAVDVSLSILTELNRW